MLLQMAKFYSLMAEYHSIVYIHHIFFTHSSVDEPLGYFHALAIINNPVMNTGMPVVFALVDFFSHIMQEWNFCVI